MRRDVGALSLGLEIGAGAPRRKRVHALSRPGMWHFPLSTPSLPFLSQIPTPDSACQRLCLYGGRVRHLAVPFGNARQTPHPHSLGHLVLMNTKLLCQPHDSHVLVAVHKPTRALEERQQGVGSSPGILLGWRARRRPDCTRCHRSGSPPYQAAAAAAVAELGRGDGMVKTEMRSGVLVGRRLEG